MGDASFTYEQFYTYIVEIEAILNSQPLTLLSSDPTDFIALTPAHFLIAESQTSFPEFDYNATPINKLSMWQRVQKLKQHFRKRWHKKYLNKLGTRSRWHQGDTSEVKVRQLVVIKEEDVPPRQWRVGCITAVHLGPDSAVRVVTVKTISGEHKRCVKKLAPLPIQN